MSLNNPGDTALMTSTAAETSAVDAVTVRSLSKRFGAFSAVDGVSFSLPAGTVTGFLGPNGAGKTTLLRMLLGLAEPSAGEALIFGVRYRDLRRPASVVGAVLESDNFEPGRSGRDHLRVLALASGLPPTCVDRTLDVVGLSDAGMRPAGAYSLGMKQRLGLAAALLGDPRVLVLDEPGNGLDPGAQHWLRRFLRSYAADGGTVLMSSHDLAEAAQVVDRVVILKRGRVAAAGAVEELTGGRRTLEDVYLDATDGEVA